MGFQNGLRLRGLTNRMADWTHLCPESKQTKAACILRSHALGLPDSTHDLVCVAGRSIRWQPPAEVGSTTAISSGHRDADQPALSALRRNGSY